MRRSTGIRIGQNYHADIDGRACIYAPNLVDARARNPGHLQVQRAGAMHQLAIQPRATRPNKQVACSGLWHNCKSIGCFSGDAEMAHRIARVGAISGAANGGLFIPVGIGKQPPLLHPNQRKRLFGSVGVSGKIARHYAPSYLTYEMQACAQAKG